MISEAPTGKERLELDMNLASMLVGATLEGDEEAPLLKLMRLGAYDPEPVPGKRPRPLKLIFVFKEDAERFLVKSDKTHKDLKGIVFSGELPAAETFETPGLAERVKSIARETTRAKQVPVASTIHDQGRSVELVPDEPD